jgi:hypothetical protein
MATMAVGFGALANASDVWAEVMVTTTFVLLVAGSVASFVSQGNARIFAIGFSFAGIGYFLLTFVDVGARRYLITNRAVLWLKDFSYQEQAENSPRAPAGNLSMSPPEDPFAGLASDPFGSVSFQPFLDIGHALWTLLFALSGGAFALMIHRASKPETTL